MMRAIVFMLFAVNSVVFAGEPPTYAEALAESKKVAALPQVKDWGEKVLQPFFDEVGATVPACSKSLSDPGSAIARLVLDFTQSPVRIHDEAPSEFSSCMRTQLGRLTWPKSPPELRYLPLEFRATLDSGANRAPENVIMSVKPSVQD